MIVRHDVLSGSMSKLPHTRYERNSLRAGFGYCIGVDEVGVGCLAGPVVVCAAYFSPEFFRTRHPALSAVRDSKLLTASTREALARALSAERLLTYRLSVVSSRSIDARNILRATHDGMAKAVHACVAASTVRRPLVLVDGNRRISDIALEQRTIVGGDRIVFTIACASILAKVHRDAFMTRAAKKYPEYGFEKHKGYGTKLHYERLALHGPSPLHRTSFRLTPR